MRWWRKNASARVVTGGPGRGTAGGAGGGRGDPLPCSAEGLECGDGGIRAPVRYGVSECRMKIAEAKKWKIIYVILFRWTANFTKFFDDHF
jgi:hypothetical protein